MCARPSCLDFCHSIGFRSGFLNSLCTTFGASGGGRPSVPGSRAENSMNPGNLQKSRLLALCRFGHSTPTKSVTDVRAVAVIRLKSTGMCEYMRFVSPKYQLLDNLRIQYVLSSWRKPWRIGWLCSPVRLQRRWSHLC